MDFGNDILTLLADLQTVSFTLRAGTAGVDQIRIITESSASVSTSGPGTGLLVGFGLLAFALRRRV